MPSLREESSYSYYVYNHLLLHTNDHFNFLTEEIQSTFL